MKNLSKEVERLEAIKDKLSDKIIQLEAERDSLNSNEMGETAYWKKWEKLDDTIENLCGEVDTLEEAINLLDVFCW